MIFRRASKSKFGRGAPQVFDFFFSYNLLWLTVLTEEREDKSLSVSSFSSSVFTSRPSDWTKFDADFRSRDLVRDFSQETGEMLRSPRLPIELAELRPSEGMPNCL